MADKFKKSNGSYIFDKLTEMNKDDLTEDHIKNILNNSRMNNMSEKAVLYLIHYKFNYHFTFDNIKNINQFNRSKVEIIMNIMNLKQSDIFEYIISEIENNIALTIPNDILFGYRIKLPEQQYKYIYRLIELNQYNTVQYIVEHLSKNITDELIDILIDNNILRNISSHIRERFTFETFDSFTKYMKYISNVGLDKEINIYNFLKINNLEYKELYDLLVENNIKISNQYAHCIVNVKNLTGEVFLLLNRMKNVKRYDFIIIIKKLLSSYTDIIKDLDLKFLDWGEFLDYSLAKSIRQKFDTNTFNESKFYLECLLKQNKFCSDNDIHYMTFHMIYQIEHSKTDDSLTELMETIANQIDNAAYPKQLNIIINAIVNRMSR